MLLTKESFTNYRNFEAGGLEQSENQARRDKPQNFSTYLTLYESNLYRINDLNCYYDAAHVFKPNFTGNFSINFTRKGYFTFQTFRRLEEEYASRIMLEKPGCVFKFVQQEPGEGGCTVFSFSQEGYELIKERYPLKESSFFTNRNAFSTILSADATADFLHYEILYRLRFGAVDHLEIDCLVTELVEAVVRLLLGQKALSGLPLNTKHHHLRTLERAKDYLIHHFTQEVTLQELARHCYVSQFYFTRLFRQFCGYSPFHYLQQIRLKYAETLIRKSNLPVADVCFNSGFKRLDYFSSAFAKQFGSSPTKYRANTRNRIVCLK
jgi:AraC family transcriptional regulator